MAREDPQLNIRLPEALRNDIVSSAGRNGRSLNSEAIELLKRGLDRAEGVSGSQLHSHRALIRTLAGLLERQISEMPTAEDESINRTREYMLKFVQGLQAERELDAERHLRDLSEFLFQLISRLLPKGTDALSVMSPAALQALAEEPLQQSAPPSAEELLKQKPKRVALSDVDIRTKRGPASSARRVITTAEVDALREQARLAVQSGVPDSNAVALHKRMVEILDAGIMDMAEWKRLHLAWYSLNLLFKERNGQGIKEPHALTVENKSKVGGHVYTDREVLELVDLADITSREFGPNSRQGRDLERRIRQAMVDPSVSEMGREALAMALSTLGVAE